VGNLEIAYIFEIFIWQATKVMRSAGKIMVTKTKAGNVVNEVQEYLEKKKPSQK